MADAVRAAIVVSLDPAVTYLAVRAGAVEGHPVWAWLIERAGPAPAMGVRLLLGLALVAAVAVAVRSDLVPVTAWVLRALTVVFGAIVAWNVLAWASAAAT